MVKTPCITCKHMLNIKKKQTRHKIHYAETCYYALDVSSQTGSAFSYCLDYGLEDGKIVVRFLDGETVFLSSQERPD